MTELSVEGLGGELRPFQHEGAVYALTNQRCFIADDMGLGKTIEALAVIQSAQAYPALIVCPASLKLQWAREARKWLPGKFVYMLDNQTPVTKHAMVSIINYEILKTHHMALLRGQFKAIVFDEAQYLISHNAQRTEFAMELAHGVVYDRKKNGRIDQGRPTKVGEPIPYRLLLTGTPLLNRVTELAPPLEIMDRLADVGGLWNITHATTARQHEILNQKMRSCCFIRRRKADVLKELPAKQRAIVPIAISNRAEYQKAERELIAYLRERAQNDKDFLESIKNLTEEEQTEAKKHRADTAEMKARAAQQLVRIEALKQCAARGKMVAVQEWIDNFLESGEKLLVFSWHQEIVKQLAFLYRCDSIYSEVSKTARQAAVDRFQEDPDTRVISINIKTGGVGFNLTAASNVALIELGWNPGTMDQAEDRTHRIGQTKQVTAWYLIAEKTIEEEIYDLIEEKRGVIDAVVDGDEPAQQASIMNELVDRLLKKTEQESLIA